MKKRKKKQQKRYDAIRKKIMEREASKEATDHHIQPSSRGGVTSNNNIKIVPLDYHRAYHKLFVNLTRSEIIDYLMEIWFTNGEFVKPNEWRKDEEDN